MSKLWIFVGTSGGESKGIYRFSFDPEAGMAGPLELAAETANPSFLALHPDGAHLYAVSAIADFGGERTGAVSAYALDAASGALKLLNRQPSAGPGPCHLVVDPSGKTVLVANYGGGSIASLPIAADGSLGAPRSAIQHAGSSVNPRRQEAPHAHSINLDPGARFALVADLGLDQVLVYRFDAAQSTLAPHDPPHASTAPGAGPRHLAFHPNGQYAYVINELDSTVTAFRYCAEAGTLTKIQAVTTLPDGWSGENYPAEVLVHPSGKFLYGSNRGHDSIAIFAVDGATGQLSPTGHAASGGKWPRNFAFDPSGAWMVVGNQNSNNVRFFRVDPGNGALTPAGPAFDAPAAICFKMLPARV